MQTLLWRDGTGGDCGLDRESRLAQGRRAGLAHPSVQEKGVGSARGPAAQAWCSLCVCRLLRGRGPLLGVAGVSCMNTGLLGTPLAPRCCPSHLMFTQLIVGQVGAVSAGAPHTFPAEASLAGAPAGGMTGWRCSGACVRLPGGPGGPGGPAPGLLGVQSCFSDRCPVGSL